MSISSYLRVKTSVWTTSACTLASATTSLCLLPVFAQQTKQASPKTQTLEVQLNVEEANEEANQELITEEQVRKILELLEEAEENQTENTPTLEDLLKKAKQDQEADASTNKAKDEADTEATSEQLAQQETIEQLLEQARSSQENEQEGRMNETRTMDEPEELTEDDSTETNEAQQANTNILIKDPRAWVENLVQELKVGKQRLSLGYGQFSLSQELSTKQLAQLESQQELLATIIQKEPFVQLAPEVRVKEDHAIVLLATTNFRLPAKAQADQALLITPICLLRTAKGDWQISASIKDFSAANAPLDALTQAQFNESLQWARKTINEIRPRLSKERQERKEGIAQEQKQTLPSQPEQLLNIIAPLLLLEQDKVSSADLETLRAALGRAGTNLREDNLLNLWLKLEAWNSQINLYPKTDFEVAYQDKLLQKGNDYRQLVLLRPTTSQTRDTPQLAAFYLRQLGKEGEEAKAGETLIFSPERIPDSPFEDIRPTNLAMTQRGLDETGNQRDQLLLEMLQRATKNQPKQVTKTTSAQQTLETWLQAARTGNWGEALAMMSLTNLSNNNQSELDQINQAKQTLRTLDLASRAMIAPRLSQVYATSEGTQELWMIEGLNRSFPNKQTKSLPLSLQKTNQGWRIDFSLMGSQEATSAYHEAITNSDYQKFWNKKVMANIESATQLPPFPKANAKANEDIFLSSEAAKLWLTMANAWSSNKLEKFTTCFIRLQDGAQQPGVDDITWFYQVLGHPSQFIKLHSAHQQGDWAALTWSYMLEEGIPLYASALAVKLSNGEWKLLLPSLSVETDSELAFLKDYVSEDSSSKKIKNNPELKKLRQAGLEWARKLPNYYQSLGFQD